MKCWKKHFNSDIVSSWKKNGKYSSESDRPLIDVRRRGNEDKSVTLETYDLRRNYREIYTNKKLGIKRAMQIMKKESKC